MEMYHPGLDAFWSCHLSNSSSHLPLPPQERLMPAQGLISRQINRSERFHLPQPIYVHFPEGSYHLFLSWMLYSQEQIRFSQNMLLIAPVKLNQGALADFDKLCPTLVMENRTLHLLCPVAFTRILCVWDGSKRRISTIFILGLSYLVGPSCQWHNSVCSKAELTLMYTPPLLPARNRPDVNLSSQLLQQTYSRNKVERGKIFLILGTMCTLRHLVIWEQIINLMTQELTSQDTCNT